MRYIFSTLLVIAVLLLAFTKKEPITVTGTVTDDQGIPLVSATVLVKGTKKSTMTDAQGQFTIVVPGPNAILIIQYVGFESREFKVNSSQKLQVQLKASSENLKEVVVTGYGLNAKI